MICIDDLMAHLKERRPFPLGYSTSITEALEEIRAMEFAAAQFAGVAPTIAILLVNLRAFEAVIEESAWPTEASIEFAACR